MSVYSGFATRAQQKKYNQYLELLLSALSKRLIKFYAHQLCDQNKFKSLLTNLHDRMFALQQGKFMQPKFSEVIAKTMIKLERIGQQETRAAGSALNCDFLQLRQEGKRPNYYPKARINTVESIRQNDFQNQFDERQQQKFRNKIKGSILSSTFSIRQKLKTIDHEIGDVGEQSQTQVMLQRANTGDSGVSYDSSNQFMNSPQFYNPTPYKPPAKKQQRSYSLGKANEEFKMIRQMMRMPKLENFLQNPKKGQGKSAVGIKQRDRSQYISIRKKTKHQKIV